MRELNCIKLHVAIMPIFRTERFAASLILIGPNFFFSVCLELTNVHRADNLWNTYVSCSQDIFTVAV